MDLPVRPPLAPMLARAAKQIPRGPDWRYEPKWDGFRCVLFRDGDEVVLGSRNERPLTRYFPEVVAALLRTHGGLPDRVVLDGEIILPVGDRLDFGALQNRLHPADSRVRMLAAATPAAYVAFDLLAMGEEDLRAVPFGERRARLDALWAGPDAPAPPLYLTPLTADPDVAARWFTHFEGAGLDGLVCKGAQDAYQPDKRVMVKVKHERTVDTVVAGLRWHTRSTPEDPMVGSLLLGVYDTDAALVHVGVCAAFPTATRRALVGELAALREGAETGHPWSAWIDAEARGRAGAPEADRRTDGGPSTAPPRAPGGAVSRWNATKDLSWVALRPERVLEVAYDHMEGHRFRHTAQFRRWRPDRDPRSATTAQLDRPPRFDLAAVLGRSGHLL